MEDLDKTLDIMERDKCTSLLAENAVRLKKNNIKGVHLELSITNKRAFNFYKRYGMSELERDDDSIFMGLHI